MLTSALQVYEHVYETVDISSSPEVRANATAKVSSWGSLWRRSWSYTQWVGFKN